jgi:hypothetical protein
MIYARTTLHMLTQVFLVIHITRHINTDFMQPPFCSTFLKRITLIAVVHLQNTYRQTDKSRPRNAFTLNEQFIAPATTSSPTAVSLKNFVPNFVKICRPVNSWKRENHNPAHTQCAVSLMLCLNQRPRVKMRYFSDAPLLQASLSWIWCLLIQWSSHV